MHIFHWSTHGGEGAAHQSLRTIELHLSNNAIRLKVRNPETRTTVSNGIRLMTGVATDNKCDYGPSNTILSFSPAGGCFEIARLTVIRLSGTLANRTQRIRTCVSHVG